LYADRENGVSGICGAGSHLLAQTTPGYLLVAGLVYGEKSFSVSILTGNFT